VNTNVIDLHPGDKDNFEDCADFKEYLLCEIRAARIQAQLWQAQLDTVGIALKAGMITPDKAIRELNLKLVARGDQ
jgi:hypothetical protein